MNLQLDQFKLATKEYFKMEWTKEVFQDDILQLIEASVPVFQEAIKSEGLDSADLIERLKSLDSSTKEAQNRLHVLNKRLLDHFKRKKVGKLCTFAYYACLTETSNSHKVSTAVNRRPEDIEIDEAKYKPIFVVNLNDLEKVRSHYTHSTTTVLAFEGGTQLFFFVSQAANK